MCAHLNALDRVCASLKMHAFARFMACMRTPARMCRTINPAMDLGQVEGAFVFGMGMVLSEHMEHDHASGESHVEALRSWLVAQHKQRDQLVCARPQGAWLGIAAQNARRTNRVLRCASPALACAVPPLVGGCRASHAPPLYVCRPPQPRLRTWQQALPLNRLCPSALTCWSVCLVAPALCSPGALLQGTAVRHCCGAQLWGTAVGHCCEALLWGTAVRHCCEALLWGTAVGHCCGALHWDTAKKGQSHRVTAHAAPHGNVTPL